MPPKPTTPMSRASHTWTRRSACISARIDSSPLGGWCGRKTRDGHDGQGRDGADEDVGQVPREALAEQRRERHPDDVGDPEAAEDGRDRGGASLVRHEGGGDDRADAEEGTVREAGEEPRGHDGRVGVGREDGEVRDGEEGHQAHEQALARDLGRGDGDERGPDDDAERVGRDVVAGRRDVDAGAVGDLRQQAHRHELRRADGEAAHGEGEDGEGRAACWRGSQGFSGFGRSIGGQGGGTGVAGGVVRIAVDPVSDPNGNGGAATVIPMSSTFERLLGRLRGIVRGASSPTRAPSDRSPAEPRDGAAATGRRPARPTPATRRGCPTRRTRPRPDGRPDPGEIVWTWVPYEEDHSQGKDRPVLVIGRDGDWLVALPLTSKDHDRDEQQERRSGREWVDIGSGAWDGRGRPERGAGQPAGPGRSRRGAPRGCRAPPRPLRRGRRRGARPARALSRPRHPPDADRARHHEVTGPLTREGGASERRDLLRHAPTSCWRPGSGG